MVMHSNEYHFPDIYIYIYVYIYKYKCICICIYIYPHCMPYPLCHGFVSPRRSQLFPHALKLSMSPLDPVRDPDAGCSEMGKDGFETYYNMSHKWVFIAGKWLRPIMIDNVSIAGK